MGFLSLQSILPPGVILPFAGTTAPDGWRLCNGASLSTTSFPALFAVIGYTYGGSGSSFLLPDTQGLFLRGAGSQTFGSVTYSAAALGSKQNDATKKNGLAVSDPGHYHSAVSPIGPGLPGTPPSSNIATWTVTGANTGNDSTYGWTGKVGTGVSLGSGDTETRPGNISVNYIIKL